MVRGDGKMDDPITARHAILSDLERHRIAAIAARSGDERIGAERGRNAQRVPNADPPVRLVRRFDAEARRHCTEWIRGPDIAVVRRQNEYFARRQVSDGLQDLHQRTAKRLGNLRRLRHASGVGRLTKYVQAYVSREVVQRQ